MMKDDPLRKELLAELRALRRSANPLGLEQIATCARLIQVIGSGSVEQAHSVLLDLFDQQSYLEESDVVTFFKTCGVEVAGSTLDARLNSIAESRYVDPRTVLRHSNAGADKLSYIVRDMTTLYRPLGKVNLLQRGNSVTCQIIIRLPRHSRYRKPDVYIDGGSEKVPNLEWSLSVDPNDPDWLVATETISAPLCVTTNTSRYMPVWSVAVYWLMPVWASWANAFEFSDPRLSTVLSVTRNHRAEVALYFDRERTA